jgi:4-hydroxy-4-methyl-2-oxoglutarate aldolase
MKSEIIEYIRKNRISTTEVADALGKKGVLNRVHALSHDLHKVGPVRCAFAAFESNYSLHEQVRDVQPGEIVVVYCHECKDRAVLGDLITRFVLFYRSAEAIVVDGAVRDGARLRRERYAVWAKEVTPLGCFNTPAQEFPKALASDYRNQADGGIAVCDDGGVVIIPRDLVNQEMLQRLVRIEMQEDIWFFCLNTLKWDTKKIVCDKAYLTEPNLLSSVQLSQLAELQKPLDEKLS